MIKIFVKYNSNPNENLVDDCVIRAIAVATGNSWDDIYLDLMIKGYLAKDYPNKNAIWWSYLSEQGFKREFVRDFCPMCYTLSDFIREHPKGKYVVGDGSHTVAVIDGNYIDTFDSGNMSVLYYFKVK